jgi:hypothetical protein
MIRPFIDGMSGTSLAGVSLMLTVGVDLCLAHVHLDDIHRVISRYQNEVHPEVQSVD